MYPANKVEWQNSLVRLVNEKKYRESIALLQSTFIKENNLTGNFWKSRLANCYSKLRSLTHHTTVLKKSNWYYSSNEKHLLEVQSQKIALTGIVTTKSIFFKLFVFFIYLFKVMVTESLIEDSHCPSHNG
mgnify:CR=1 FL=1